jgi:hypothetical protein
MDRIQLEQIRDEKRAELKFIEDLLSKQPIRNVFRTSRDTSRDTSQHDVPDYKSYKTTKTYKPPPSGKTWFDWMRSVVQSNDGNMLLAKLGSLASKNGFVLDESDKLSNFVGRVYGLKLYMSDEEHPRMFVTVSDSTRSELRTPSRGESLDKSHTQSHEKLNTNSNQTENCINAILGTLVPNDVITDSS